MPQSVTKEADGTLTLTLEDGESLGGFDQVLVAAGREPVLDKLGLESAGVKTDRGHITVRASSRPQRQQAIPPLLELTQNGPVAREPSGLVACGMCCVDSEPCM